MTTTRKIVQFEPWLDEAELAQLKECIDSNWITGGPKVKEFERQIAELHQVKHAIACSNGTVALYMALKAMGIGPKDEVIVPDFTFIASANAIVLAGGKPIFADVDRETWNLTVGNIRDALDKAPHAKAVMPVHIYGRPCQMHEIMAYCGKMGLGVIEDAAQGVGVKYQGKPVGSFGVGCLSWFSDKTLTTGEGGTVLTDSDKIAEECMYLKHQGRLQRGVYIHERIGYNFRLTDLQAGIGLAQLQKLPQIIRFKRGHEDYFRWLLRDIVSFPPLDSQAIPFRHNILVADPQKLSDFLATKGIASMRFFHPLHSQPCYNQKGDFPNTENAYLHGLSLPSSALLPMGDIEYICESIKEFYVH